MFRNQIKKITLILIGFFGLIVIAGICWQYIYTKINTHKYPPPGQMVDVGGYRLHINCQGKGEPVVILDSGLGGNSLEWSLVQPKVAKFTRVCSIDRAGLGWSEKSPLERTSQNIVSELHTLLQKASIPGPYILVGHSFGGLNIRLFAMRYPDEVAGVVLVDSAHEKQLEKISLPKINKNRALLSSYIGLHRLKVSGAAYKKSVEMFPDKIQKIYLGQMGTTKHVSTVLKERENAKKSSDQLSETGGFLGDIPLTVISATEVKDENERKRRKVFMSFQEDLLTKSTNSKQLIAEKSDHMITRHQPSIIVEAIKAQVDLVRTKQKNL